MKFKSSALLGLICAPLAQASDITITGVIDGPLSGGLPKAVELYVVNDIPDLSVCGIGSANNGGGSDGQEFTFSGVSALAGSYITVAAESVEFTNFFGFGPDYTHSAANINGDDAIELFCNGIVVDTFGDINVDGTAQDWEYMDGWAHRNESTGPDGSTFVLGNWSYSGANALDGELSNSSAAAPYPIGSNGSGGGGGSGSTEVCFNCPPLDKIADASTFDDASYYAAVIDAVANNWSASEIKSAITTAITQNHNVLTYSEVWTALTETDEDPANTDNVILWYKGTSLAKMSNGSGTQSNDPDNWNREHSWPSSHGFGEQSFEAYTDIHHVRPTDISVNESRGNLDFDNSDAPLPEAPSNNIDDDSFEPRDAIKGDVARMMLYVDTRYEGFDTTPDLQIVDRLTSSGEPALGRLCRLLEWHNADPVDAVEQLRNDRIYEYQGNRNPFIDHPEWVATLYGTQACDGGTGGGSGEEPGGETPAPTVALLISEYVEGSSYNKAIELYNPSAQDIDLSISNYQLGRFSNGATSATMIDLTGVISSKGTYVIAHSSAADALQGLADQLSGSLSHNGDDAYVLYQDGVAVDSFGRVGEDPGTSWGSDTYSTVNNTLRRNSTVVGGDTVVDDLFEPSAQWTGAGNDDFSDLGSHTMLNPEIYISEYVEGSSNNKAIELYNPSVDVIDLSALNYQLSRFSNGGTSGTAISLNGFIPAKGTYVIANSSAAQSILDIADQASGSISHNGDDAYILYKDGEIIDSFGRVGEDPGSAWGAGDTSTVNHTLVRKEAVTEGDTIADDVFDPAIEWDGHASDTFSFLGSHNNDGGSGGEDPIVSIGLCTESATLISSVQGTGFSSTLVGESLIVEGVVTGSFTELNGFFMQEELADEDGNPLTSEGIFIANGENTIVPTAGDVVRVIGDVAESYGKTQISAVLDILICGTDTVTATAMTLPFASNEAQEALEGMLVTSAAPLTVTDNYNLGLYGEVGLSNGRKYIPTNLHLPGSQEAIVLAAQNSLNSVTLDDGVNGSNPENVIYPTGGLSASNTLRVGDLVTELTGTLDYSFGRYRVIPIHSPTFSHDNSRTAAPELTLGNVKVASLNVLNLFNGDGLGGGYPTSRGADSAQEYERQVAKTVTAILAIDADIVGLMEIENDGGGENSTIADLVNRLNAVAGSGTYQLVNAGGAIGTDAIAVGLLYKPAVVTASESVKLNMDGVFNRPPMAQTFSLNENGESFTVVVNHFKSKGGCSSATGADADQGDGQACYNATRVTQAQTLINWLNTDPQLSTVEDMLVIGDLNAYAMEDPIRAFTDNGFTNLINLHQGSHAYSYLYGGESGYLDHALASTSLAAKSVDAADWHINADEPRILDYNLEYKSLQQQTDFYADDAYRMSDHDPVVIALQLDAPFDPNRTEIEVPMTTGLTDEQIAKFINKISQWSEKIGSLQSQINELETQIAGLDPETKAEKIAKKQAKIANKQARISIYQSLTTALELAIGLDTSGSMEVIRQTDLSDKTEEKFLRKQARFEKKSSTEKAEKFELQAAELLAAGKSEKAEKKYAKARALRANAEVYGVLVSVLDASL